VFLDEILQGTLDEIVALILLQGEDNLGSTSKAGVNRVALDGEVATSLGLPDVLLVVVVLGDDSNGVSNEVGRVETRKSAPTTKLKLTLHQIGRSWTHQRRLGSFA
jgi:hypothetical protein